MWAFQSYEGLPGQPAAAMYLRLINVPSSVHAFRQLVGIGPKLACHLQEASSLLRKKKTAAEPERTYNIYYIYIQYMPIN